MPLRSPHAVAMGRLLSGYRLSTSLFVIAELGIADVLSAGPLPVQQIAARVDVDEHALYRVLRSLAAQEVFAESAGRVFSQTQLSAELRSDAPAFQRWVAIRRAAVRFPKCTPSRLLEVLRTGVMTEPPPASVEAPKPLVEMAKDKTARGYSTYTSGRVIDNYDFSATDCVVDVGGGKGEFLGALLTRYPRMRGINLDVPALSGQARTYLEAVGVAERCQVLGADLFDGIPPGGGVYMLMFVAHGMGDERLVSALRRIRAAMGPEARLLVVEALIGSQNHARATEIDVEKMILLGDRDRTIAEYQGLLRAADLMFVQATPLDEVFEDAMIEARVV